MDREKQGSFEQEKPDTSSYHEDTSDVDAYLKEDNGTSENKDISKQERESERKIHQLQKALKQAKEQLNSYVPLAKKNEKLEAELIATQKSYESLRADARTKLNKRLDKLPQSIQELFTLSDFQTLNHYEQAIEKAERLSQEIEIYTYPEKSKTQGKSMVTPHSETESIQHIISAIQKGDMSLYHNAINSGINKNDLDARIARSDHSRRL